MTTKNYLPLDLVAPVLFAAVFLFTLIFSKIEPHVDDVNAAYVKAHLSETGYVLVDAHPEEVFNGKSPRPGVPGGHIPGAVSFPLDDLNIRAAAGALSKAGITKDKIIIIYGNSGFMSGRFAEQLVKHFHFRPSKLKNYRGSNSDWITYPENILLPEDHETGY